MSDAVSLVVEPGVFEGGKALLDDLVGDVVDIIVVVVVVDVVITVVFGV